MPELVRLYIRQCLAGLALGIIFSIQPWTDLPQLPDILTGGNFIVSCRVPLRCGDSTLFKRFNFQPASRASSRTARR